MRTLWDLLLPRTQQRPSRSQPPRRSTRPGVRERYDEITRVMLERYSVRVRRWRSSMSGIAWEVRYRDGTTARLIEAPRPRGPMSVAVFLHEIGHHAIGFGRYSPRCLEEFHAWTFALAEMERLGLAVTPRVHTRVRDSLRYAVAKARRRGLRRIPAELARYV